MQSLTGKVAVITGAAEGIGRALAEKAAGHGMRLVLADINPDTLRATADRLRADGVDVLDQRLDVRDEAAVAALADAAFARFGTVHLLVNNAGVSVLKPAWETSKADWEWVLGVNLYGVIHGLSAFLPRMIAGGEEGHVVNTASVAGLASHPGLAAYNVSKHGVVTLSEGLFHDLVLRRAKIGVSVLCPSWVKTGIGQSERNRASDERTDFARLDKIAAHGALAIQQAVENGIEPADVADQVFDAVVANRFYIITHQNSKAMVKVRMDDILLERPPTLFPV